MRIKQSVCFPIFRSKITDLGALFGAIAGIGYPAVELWGRGDDFAEVVQLADANGLRIASMLGHSGLAEGFNNRAHHERLVAELRESIEIAAHHGIPGLICMSGNRLPHRSDLQAIDAVVDGLRLIAPYAERKGVNINLELLNSKVNHPGYQCDHTAWGVAVCEKVASPRVKLLYDIYHMQIMEGDVIRTIRENIRWIGHFHTAGNPGRQDFDDTQELNYTGICKAIAATEYDLYVGHEFVPKGDILDALRYAYRVCDQAS
jgi:hydroxypyruvate isomerase